MKPTPKQLASWLISGTVITAGAIALIIFFVIPADYQDYRIRQGYGTPATAVVTGYYKTGTANDVTMYALNLRIDTGDNGTLMVKTGGAFNRYTLQRMGVWDGQEVQVRISYIGTRAVVEGQPTSFPVVLAVALMFGVFGIIVLVASIFQAKTGRQMISNDPVGGLKKRFNTALFGNSGTDDENT